MQAIALLPVAMAAFSSAAGIEVLAGNGYASLGNALLSTMHRQLRTLRAAVHLAPRNASEMVSPIGKRR